MGVYIYITEEETKRLKTVSDPELNELFQEALKADESLLIEEKEFIKTGWFGRHKYDKRYTLYHESRAHDGSAYQAQQVSGISSTKISAMTYLFGIINGAFANEKKHISSREQHKN